MTEQEMKALGYKVIDYIVEHRLNYDNEKVSNIGTYDDLSKEVGKEVPLHGEDPAAVFEELNTLIKNNIVHLDHPRFFSFIPGPSNYLSVLADTLSTTTKLKGHLALRMCPIHPETTKEHLSETVALMNSYIEDEIINITTE